MRQESGEARRFTISIGFTAAREAFGAAFKLGDAELYQAKDGGTQPGEATGRRRSLTVG